MMVIAETVRVHRWQRRLADAPEFSLVDLPLLVAAVNWCVTGGGMNGTMKGVGCVGVDRPKLTDDDDEVDVLLSLVIVRLYGSPLAVRVRVKG